MVHVSSERAFQYDEDAICATGTPGWQYQLFELPSVPPVLIQYPANIRQMWLRNPKGHWHLKCLIFESHLDPSRGNADGGGMDGNIRNSGIRYVHAKVDDSFCFVKTQSPMCGVGLCIRQE